MEWYKHDASATQDAKIKKLLMYSERVAGSGVYGYAVYFHCLELIAGDISVNNITFQLEHDSEIIADTLKIRGTGDKSGRDLVEEIMRYMIDIGLFEHDDDKISCHKLAKRLDQSMTSNKRMRALISDIRESRKGNVYILKSKHGYKIGKTKNYQGRLSLFSVKLPFEFEVLRLYESENYQELETYLHNMFSEKLINGEWYDLSDNDITDVDVYIKEAGGAVMINHDKSCKKRIEENRIEEKRVSKATHETGVPINETTYQSLLEDYGKATTDGYIQRVADYCAAHGKKYKDYSAAARNWMRRDEQEGKLQRRVKVKRPERVYGGLPDSSE